ncbi:hypothetical protein CB1_000746012 [Camelus ferus]|nr:hypothetical protein CB1_000746012 [Camelus ferus]
MRAGSSVNGGAVDKAERYSRERTPPGQGRMMEEHLYVVDRAESRGRALKQEAGITGSVQLERRSESPTGGLASGGRDALLSSSPGLEVRDNQPLCVLTFTTGHSHEVAGLSSGAFCCTNTLVAESEVVLDQRAMQTGETMAFASARLLQTEGTNDVLASKVPFVLTAWPASRHPAPVFTSCPSALVCYDWQKPS